MSVKHFRMLTAMLRMVPTFVYVYCTKPPAAAWQGGRMSQYLEELAIGDTIDVKGPLGHFVYEGRGYYRSHGTPGFATKLSMIAGGTGITPMFQVIKVSGKGV